MTCPLSCFVHIPSSGGTTLWSILRRGSSHPIRRFRDDDYAENERRARELIREHGADYSVIGGHVRYGFYELPAPPLRHFTFLRDPVERLISVYFRKIRNGKHVPASEPALRSGEDLLEFARPRCRGELAFLVGPERAAAAAAEDGAAALRSILYQIRSNFVFVGILEEFDTSVHLLARELGWARVPQYDVRNRGGNKRAVPAAARQELERLLALELAVYQHFREALLGRSRRDAPAARVARLLYHWRGVVQRGFQAALVPGYATRYLKR